MGLDWILVTKFSLIKMPYHRMVYTLYWHAELHKPYSWEVTSCRCMLLYYSTERERDSYLWQLSLIWAHFQSHWGDSVFKTDFFLVVFSYGWICFSKPWWLYGPNYRFQDIINYCLWISSHKLLFQLSRVVLEKMGITNYYPCYNAQTGYLKWHFYS